MSKAHWLSAVLVLVITICANCCPASQDAYYVGRRFPSEKTAYRDLVTGYEVSMLTTSPAKDNKIYQTHPSWTADGRHIVFMSDRTGTNQYFALSVDTGVITQLTNDKGPGNAFLSRTRGNMFYISNRAIWELDINAICNLKENKPDNRFRRKVADLPEKLTVSGTLSVDSNGEDIYIGVQYGEGSWGLLALNADTGKVKLLTQGHRPRGATVHPHPSFSPDGSSVLFCSEKNGNWDLFLIQLKQ